MAITSIVLSSLALVTSGLVLVLGLLLMIDFSVAGDAYYSGMVPLTGDVAVPDPAAALPGDELATAVSGVVVGDGGDVELMECPATPNVDQGIVTVCHAIVGGEEWAIVVFFENPDGLFTLDLI